MRKNDHRKDKPSAKRFQETEKNAGRERWRHKRHGGNHDGQTQQGLKGTWVQSKGAKGGENGHGKGWQTQAHGTGCRDEWRRLAGGRSFTLREEVRSGYYTEVLR